ARLRDHVRTGRPFGDGFGHRQRNEGAAKTKHRREAEQRPETADTLHRGEAVEPEEMHDHAEQQQHGDVGGDEQEDSAHGSYPFGVWPTRVVGIARRDFKVLRAVPPIPSTTAPSPGSTYTSRARLMQVKAGACLGGQSWGDRSEERREG